MPNAAMQPPPTNGEIHEKEPIPAKVDRWLSDIGRDSKRSRKYAFGVIASLLGVTLVLGMLQLTQTLNGPFVFDANQATGVDARKTAAVKTLDELRAQDTDKDGLDDYAELYVLETSPYTSDSDSDGYSDSDEVDSDNDPNCPANTVCAADTGSLGNTLSETPNVPTDLVNMEQIRTLLQSNGVPKADLDAMTDAEVLAVYQKSLAGGTSTTGTTGVTGGTDTASQETLTNLSVTQVRELLIAAGVKKDELTKLTDEQVMEIYKQSLATQFGNSSNTNTQ